MDWEAWARRAERELDVAQHGNWKGLFRPTAWGVLFTSFPGVSRRQRRPVVRK
jgi:hypothetical protein